MPGLRITPAIFEERLRYLQTCGYNVLSLAEGLARLHAGTLPPRSVVLTFDDGFVDFYTVVLPLLRKYQMPATLYLTTFYCELNRPIFNLVCPYLLWKARFTQVAENPALGWRVPPDLSTAMSRRLAWHAVRDTADANLCSAVSKDEMAVQLAEHVGVSYSDVTGNRLLHLMTPDEAARCAQSGVAIELHTHRHRTPVDKELFSREIEDNRKNILRYTGVPPRHFCYPSGRTHPTFVRWLPQLSVESATTCMPGMTSRVSNSMLIPRYLDGNDCTSATFESWVSGVDGLARASA